MPEHIISNDENSNDILLANNINSVIGGDTSGLYHYESESVADGETANNITINLGGSLTILSGGQTNEPIINRGGYLFISSGGIANDAIVNSSGEVCVRGGTANSTIINSAGSLYVSSGGTANSTTVNLSGWLYIEKDGIADNTMIDSGAFMRIRSGGTANSTTVNSGRLELYSGGTTYNTLVNSGGEMSIYYDSDVANSTTINSGGNVYIFSHGTANSTTVNLGGKFIVSSGGTATMIVENGGFFSALPDAYTTIVPNTFSGLTLTSGISATAHSGTTATGIEVSSGGVLLVFDGGTANSTTVNFSGLLYIDGRGKVNDTTINSGGYLYVISDGTVKGITASQGAVAILSSGGQLEQSFYCEGQMAIYPGATARIYSSSTLTGESALLANWGTIDFLVASASIDETPLLNDYTKVSGYGSYTITVNGDMQDGDYILIGNAADFTNGITFTAEDTGSTAWAQWNQNGGYNTVTLDGRKYTLKHDEENNLVLSVASSQLYTILNFDDLKAQVSANWKRYNVQVKLDKFNDDFKNGWGKKTNHRSYYSVAVTDLAFSAEGSPKHIAVTCNGHLKGTIGILTVGADLSANNMVDEQNAGLFLSLDKNAETGEWEWGDWNLVGTFTVKLQKVDHRFKFHLSDTTFDPMSIVGVAEVNTIDGVYKISIDWKKSGFKVFQHMTASATLKDCSKINPNTSKLGLELSSISISVYDDPYRKRTDPGFHIYKVSGECYNLSSCDTEAAGFKGYVGFTWNSFTIRAEEQWQKKLLRSFGINADSSTLKVSVVDTELDVKMNVDGDFEANGMIRIGNACLTEYDADGKVVKTHDLYLAWISGSVSYFASNESLTVTGNVGITGMGEMSGFVWSVDDSLRLSTIGTFNVPGWMEFLTGFTTISGYVEMISTKRSTCIAVWGEANKNNGKSYYKGYKCNLTTGEVKNISNREDVLATYDDLIFELEMGKTGSALFEIYRKKYERIKSLLINGSYLGASDHLQVCVKNETTGKQINWCLKDFNDKTQETTSVTRTALRSAGGEVAGVRGIEVSVADALQDGTGILRGESDSEEEALQVYVEYFDEGGFSIRLDGDQDLLYGNWRIEICDDGADLKDLEVSLQCEETPSCQLEAFSITGMDSNSMSIDYTISGGDDEVDISVNCIKHNGENTQTICAGFLDAGENHAVIDTTVVTNSGFYELYLHVTGDFIPIDSKNIGVFSIAKRTESDGAIMEDLADISATEFWMIVSSSQDSGNYTIANSAEGFNNEVTFTTDAGDTIGTISIGETLSVGNTDYMLNLTDNALSVTVKKENKQEPDNKPDTGWNDYLWDKKKGWNTNIEEFASNEISGNGEINLDIPGTVDKDGKHNLFGNDGTNTDTGDVAKIKLDSAAQLTFSIDSTAAGTFYVYEDGFDKKGNRAQIQVAKVSVKANATTTLKDVCLTADGNYYVAMVAKNVKKAGTEGLYNVSVTNSTFFVDADDGWNNTAAKGNAVEVEHGTTAIVLDNNEMDGSTEFANFVGFSDSIDYAKLNLASSAYLSFNVKADGAAKFTIWKQDAKGKLTKVGGVTSLTAKNKFTATTKAQFFDVDKYQYYLSMECTDAAKGGSAYYDISVSPNSVFFDSSDNGENNWLYDKKENAVNELMGSYVGTYSETWIDFDYDVYHYDYYNFVGYGDTCDYSEIYVDEEGLYNFKIDTTGKAKFTVYSLTRNSKGKWTQKALGSQTIKDVNGATGVTLKKDVKLSATNDDLRYFVSMQATDTKKSPGVYYNVMSFPTAVSEAAALAMPETSDNLNLTDAQSFASPASDLLADASASALADLDDKTGWMNIASLA